MTGRGSSVGRSLGLLLLLASLLASCTSTQSVRIEITPAAGVLNLGGTTTFVVSIASSTAPGPFALDTGTLPDGVSASFSDDTLGAAGDSSELTLTAEVGAEEGIFTLTVTASGTAASTWATFELTIETLTVTGRVGGYLRQPMPGVGVLVSGRPATTTAADGTFTVEGVLLPYDLTVYFAAEGWAEVYQGLTTGVLDVVPLGTTESTVNFTTANVTGDLTPAVPLDNAVTLCLEGVGSLVYGCTTANGGATSYSLPATWVGGIDAEARLRVVQYSVDTNFNPVAITGSGAASPFALTEGGTVDVDVAIGGTIPSTSVEVSIASPFPSVDHFVNIGTVLPGGQTFAMPSFRDASSPVAAFAPAYTGSSYAIAAQAVAADGRIGLAFRSGITGAGTQSLTVPDAPAFVQPADMATGVGTGTDFSVSGTPGRVNHFVFRTPTDFLVVVTTEAETVRIPDLTAQGLPLPPSTGLTWVVLNSPDHTDVNATAADGGIMREYLDVVLLAGSAGPPPPGDVSLAISGSRSFTTAP